MKCTIPEISWHNRDPVLSIDIQPKFDEKTAFYRLATGGTDSHILIWHLIESDDGRINPDIAAILTRHQKAVNTVRWSPSGEYLASGDDESVIFIWKLKSETETLNICDTTSEQDKEIWVNFKILRGHLEDVYDLSWSPDSLNLISASVDNTAIVWDVTKGKAQSILRDHQNFVQGVAWDPKNQYLITMSTDRYMRTYDVNSKKMICRSGKSVLPVPLDSPLSGKMVRLFHDETLQTFYRRLCFSPDGQLIIAPAGVAELYGESNKPIHTTYLYTRFDQKTPAAVLPSPDEFTIAVRCCPLLFELRECEKSNPPIIDLPYRMVFAVATKSSVCLYDTQQKMPFGLISNIHYERLTDLAWSSDGRVLVVSSSDGFCTLITFSDNELGTIYVKNGENCRMEIEENVNENPIDLKENEKLERLHVAEKLIDNQLLLSKVRTMSPTIKTASTKDKIIEIPSNIIEIDDKFKETDKKTPTPIAIRRKPRVILKSESTSLKQNPNEDDALDAWPIELSKVDDGNVHDTSKSISDELESKRQVTAATCLVNESTTNDIHLVYEESLESSEDDVIITPNSKTPRRVELRTISTPKSIKKLF